MASSTTNAGSRQMTFTEVLRRLIRSQGFLLALGIAAIMIAMTFISPYFMTLQNIRSLLIGTTMVGIIAVGMVAVLATGGLDLSVGSSLALAGVIAGIALGADLPVTIAILLALLAAAAVGLVNGLCISKLDFDPFITTLATMIMVRGILLVISGGRAVTEMDPAYNQLGQGSLLGFQLPVYFFVIIAVIGGFLFRKIRLFRLTYYVGSNEESARMSGINVQFVKTFAYVLVGLLAGASGILMSARMGMASVTIAQQTNLQVLAACVIGGSSLRGGQGTVIGAVLGAFLLQLLVNSLNIAGMGIYWQQVFTGAVLLAAIGLDRIKRQ